MRVLIFHGYLLHGTGSNVYNTELASALVKLGHEVHLVCQERRPFDFDWVDAAADWDGGELSIESRRDQVRATVYRPDIAGLLPVFVADRYDGVEAKVFPELTATELDHYIENNAAAVKEIAARVQPEVALANHLVMGPVILARALGEAVPYAVKVHGSDIEYALQPHPRFRQYAEEGVSSARAVLVGSSHIAKRLHETVNVPGLEERVILGPPGVNIGTFTPQEPDLEDLIGRLRQQAESTSAASSEAAPKEASTFDRDIARSAQALTEIEPTDKIVIFVGKLIGSKGVDLLLAAWPLVCAQVPNARLVIVGFGAFEEGLKDFQARISRGELHEAGGVLTEGGQALEWVQAFFATLEGDERRQFQQAASKMESSISWIGRLDHSELVDLLPAADAMVVPSVFPEAFGMVAIEGAACGVFPIVTDHSGLAEVATVFSKRLSAPANQWLTFPKGPAAIQRLADNLTNWLNAPESVREQTRAALVRITRATYSWEGVAKRVIAAGLGEIDQLPRPETAGEDRILRP